MAGGTPVVASPVGALNEIVVDGRDGLVADTNGDWGAALERLITDHDLRVRLGAAARVDVEHRWSFEAHTQTFENALRGLRPDGA
jgi:glycosyltransferase involved in cell wall biosynthesis